MNKKTKMIIMITAAIIAVAAIAGGIIYFISSRNDNQPPTLTEVVESRVAAYRTDPVSYTHLDVYKRQVLIYIKRQKI